jgi:hypothetical protein
VGVGRPQPGSGRHSLSNAFGCAWSTNMHWPCPADTPPGTMEGMDQETAEEWAQDRVESWNAHDLDRALSHFSADAPLSRKRWASPNVSIELSVDHTVPTTGRRRPATARSYQRHLHTHFPCCQAPDPPLGDLEASISVRAAERRVNA